MKRKISVLLALAMMFAELATPFTGMKVHAESNGADVVVSDNEIDTDDAEDSFIPSRDLRAFIQDFTTTAQFVITAGSADGTTAGSLTKAMSTIPDLRASSQTIGLSVDLTWRTGLTFNANLGE